MSQTITCIIPCYNGALTIERAVKSAIDAGCDEVLVFNDASTDDTSKVLYRLSRECDEVIHFNGQSPFPNGVNYARNYLVDMADSESLIIPLDCDDTLNDVSPLIAAWEKGTWVYGDYNIHDDNGTRLVKGSHAGALPRKEITGVTFLFHRDDWFKCGGYSPDFAFAEDYSMQCNLVHHGVKPKYVEHTVYERYLKPEGNQRTILAGMYFEFYRTMCRRKYPNAFNGIG